MGQGLAGKLWERFKLARRSGWFLAVLLVILAVSWWLVLFSPPPTAPRPVMCGQCGHAEVRELIESRIGRCRCRKCGGRVGFVWKCAECDFEFPLVLDVIKPGRMTREEKLKHRLNEWRCPNCRSADCFQMGMEEFARSRPQ